VELASCILGPSWWRIIFCAILHSTYFLDICALKAIFQNKNATVWNCPKLKAAEAAVIRGRPHLFHSFLVIL
jgi:hypothetical protein